MKNDFDENGLTPEGSWPKMEQQLDRHFAAKRRKRIVLMSLPLLLLLSGIVWWNFRSDDSVDHIGNTVPASKIDAVSADLPSSAKPVSKVSSRSNDRAEKVEAAVRDAEARHSAVLNRTLTHSANPTAVAVISAVLAPATTPSSPITHPVSGSAPTKPVDASAAGESDLQTASVHAQDERSSAESTQATIQSSATLADVPVSMDQAASMTSSEAPLVQTSPEKSATRNETEPQTTLNSDKLSSKTSAEDQPLAAQPLETKTVKDSALPSPKSFASRTSVEITVSKQAVSRTLDAPNQEWVDRRSGEEEVLPVYTYALSVIRSAGGWRFGAGLEYGRWKETTWYSGLVLGDSLVDNSYWTYLVDSLDTLYMSGNQLFLRDATPDLIDSNYTTLFDTLTGLVVDPSLKTRNAVVEWSYIQLPVRIGYSFGSGRIRIGGQAMLAPGLITRVNGRYLDASLDKLTDAGKVAPVRKFQLTASLGLSLEYVFTDRWSLSVVPEWRKQFFSVYQKETGIDQRFGSYGISAGVRYRLGK